ncbi:MAG: DUF2330 domain-containing protein [Deltaproteobacteria bacterium]|nr:DUF2330 domain-containing protein [Deltaproteobacteria bacterium]
MHRAFLWAFLAVLLEGAAAEACGGCFAPPPASPDRAQVVTDHRMVLALSQRQTTLWDQIAYTGNPEDFVWVLPVANAATLRMGLADNNFVDALDGYTAPYVTFDPPACVRSTRPRPDGGGGFLFGCGAGGEAGLGNFSPGGGSESTRIMRDGEAVVGPYAVTVIGSKAGGGQLDTWLTEHGYVIPGATRAVIGYYIDLQFDFIIMRLRPGAGVHQMQPIRVTTRGYSPVLPLRMIAAGVADKVGLTLMVVADSRVEAHGFANVTLNARDLVSDYTTGRSNWRELFASTLRSHAGRAWVTESVQGVFEDQVVYAQGRLPPAPMNARTVPFDAGPDALTDGGLFGDGALLGDAPPLRADPDGGDVPMVDRYVDRRYLFNGLPTRAIVTRLRTELSLASLNQDLVLDAAETDDPIPVEYVSGTVRNAPVCIQPRQSGCSVVGASVPAVLEVLFVVGVALRIRRRRQARKAP